MDINFRDWLVILGGILILGILIDAVRRSHGSKKVKYVFEKRNKKRKDADLPYNPYGENGDPYHGQFPNGGARVSRVEPSLNEDQFNKESVVPVASAFQEEMQEVTAALQNANEAELENPDVLETQHTYANKRELVEPDFASEEIQEPALAKKAEETKQTVKNTTPVQAQEVDDFEEDVTVSLSVKARMSQQGSLPNGEHFDDVLFAEPDVAMAMAIEKIVVDEVEIARSKKEEELKVRSRKQDEVVEEILMFSVMAKNGSSFTGTQILQALLPFGLRFGDMDLFHHYVRVNGQEVTQFRVANAVNPGIFNIDDMEDFNSPGITFFMSLPGPVNALQTYNTMLSIGEHVTKQLNGVLRDDKHSDMMPQTKEHYRQTIRDFEHHRLMLRRQN